MDFTTRDGGGNSSAIHTPGCEIASLNDILACLDASVAMGDVNQVLRASTAAIDCVDRL
jgi:hypothetical protein